MDKNLKKIVFLKGYFYRKMIPQIHLAINAYCNSKCTYCGTYNLEGEIDKEILDNTLKIIKTSKVKYFFLEGGEPTVSKNFFYTLDLANNYGLKVVLLTNGRVPKNIYNRLKKYLGTTIIRIVIHLPIGKEPLYNIWLKESDDFLKYLFDNIFKNLEILVIGVLWSNRLKLEEISILSDTYKKYNGLISSVGFCFPHPGIYGKHYIEYNDRINMLQIVIEFLSNCKREGINIFTDFIMGCILKDAYDKGFFNGYNELYNSMLDKIVPTTKYYEIHIGMDGKGFLISSLSGTSYVDTDIEVYKYRTFKNLEYFLEKKALGLLANKQFPSKCIDCKQFLVKCRGDHFNLISQLEKDNENKI